MKTYAGVLTGSASVSTHNIQFCGEIRKIYLDTPLICSYVSSDHEINVKLLDRCVYAGPTHGWEKSTGKVSAPGSVVQGTISLTSSLVVKILTVLVSIISNSQLFLLKKCE